MRIFILPFFIYCSFKWNGPVLPKCCTFYGVERDMLNKISRALELHPELESDLSHIAKQRIVDVKNFEPLNKIEKILDRLLEGDDVLNELRIESRSIKLNLGSEEMCMMACLSGAPMIATVVELLKEMHPGKTLDELLEMSLDSLFDDLDNRLDTYFGTVNLGAKTRAHLKTIKPIDMINSNSRLRYNKKSNTLKVHGYQRNATFQDPIFGGLGFDVLVIICGFGSSVDIHENSRNLGDLGARYSTSKIFDKYKAKIGFPEGGQTHMIVNPGKDEENNLGFFDLTHKELTGSSNIYSSPREYLQFLNWVYANPRIKEFLFQGFQDIANPQTTTYLSKENMKYSPSSYIIIRTPGVQDLVFGHGLASDCTFCMMSGKEVFFHFSPSSFILNTWNMLFKVTNARIPILMSSLDKDHPQNRMIFEYYNSQKPIFDPIHYLAQDKTILIPLIMLILKHKSRYSIVELLQMSLYDIFTGSHQTLSELKIKPEDKLADILSPYYDAPVGWTVDGFLAGLAGLFDRLYQEEFSMMFEENKHLVGLSKTKMGIYGTGFTLIIDDPEEYTEYINWLTRKSDHDVQELLKGSVIDTPNNGYYNESRGYVSFTLCGLNRFKYPGSPPLFFGYNKNSVICCHRRVQYYTPSDKEKELDKEIRRTNLYQEIQKIWNDTGGLLPVPRAFVKEDGPLVDVWKEYNAQKSSDCNKFAV